MLLKIAVAFLTPILCVVLVGGLVKVTHHDQIPPLVLPSVTHTPAPSPHLSPVAAPLGSCLGAVPARLTGIAVKHDPSATLAAYSKTFPNARPRIVEFYNAFKKPFGRAEATQAVDDGLIPLIQLNAWGVSEQQITNGVWDRHLKNYAEAVKAFGCTIILSFGHEMNGWWYPWGREPAPKPSTTPQEFIDAWRHIHDIFTKLNVANVIWSWDPSHQYGEPAPGKIATPASEWYPGPGYVDWVGLDGYLGYDRNGHAQDFNEIFGYQLRDIRKIAPGKPVYLAETGVRRGPAVASQIAELFSGVAVNHLMGLVWFDAKSSKHDYRLGVYQDVDAAYLKSLTGFVNG